VAIRDSLINSYMNKIVIYSGRFHPFHKGHKASYDYLTKQFGKDNVYVATSNAMAPLTSPFSFEEKKSMAEKLGVPADKVVMVKNPYQAKEITSKINKPEDTVLVYALSEKDIDRFQFTKKDGTPGYIQPYPKDEAHLKDMTQNSYAFLTPTVKFKIAGKDLDSASAIRKLYIDSDDAGKNRILKDLYGKADKELKSLFDRKLGITEELSRIMTTLKEGVADKHDANMRKVELALEMEREVKAIEEANLENASFINTEKGHRIMPAGGMGSWDFDGLRKSVVDTLEQVAGFIRGGQLDTAYTLAYRPGAALEKKLQALALYDQWMDAHGNKPLPMDKEVQLKPKTEDYIEEAWSAKYKKSINCNDPKGFSQKAHCAGKKSKSKK
jgi:hypothetical protein